MFKPELDVVYLIKSNAYCVIKKPEPIPGEKELMVMEGCTVLSDGRWWYWRRSKPQPYTGFLSSWSDRFQFDPDYIVRKVLNEGTPAPVFKARIDNNWQGKNEKTVPSHVTDEMLGDLTVAHFQLTEETREGKPPLKTA